MRKVLGLAALSCVVLVGCSDGSPDEVTAYSSAVTDGPALPGPITPACEDIWNVGDTLPAFYFEFSCTYGNPERLARSGTKCPGGEEMFRFDGLWAATPSLKVRDADVKEPPC